MLFWGGPQGYAHIQQFTDDSQDSIQLSLCRFITAKGTQGQQGKKTRAESGEMHAQASEALALPAWEEYMSIFLSPVQKLQLNMCNASAVEKLITETQQPRFLLEAGHRSSLCPATIKIHDPQKEIKCLP